MPGRIPAGQSREGSLDVGALQTARPTFSELLDVLAAPEDRKAAETALARALRALTATKAMIEVDRAAWAASHGTGMPRDVKHLRQVRDLIPRSGSAQIAIITPAGNSEAGADLAFGAADAIRAWR